MIINLPLLNPLLFITIYSFDFRSLTSTSNVFLFGKIISIIVLLNNSCIFGLYIMIKSSFFLIKLLFDFVLNFKI